MTDNEDIGATSEFFSSQTISSVAARAALEADL
jgi:hypothetical protein